MGEVIFENFVPNKKQEKFLLAKEKYVAFGGARGGGKSWVVRAKAILLCCKYEGIKILFIRRTYPELYRNHITILEPMLKGIATYNRQNKEFTFTNGSKMMMGYLQDEGDLRQYQGIEVDALFVDEATQITEQMFKMLTACVRGANKFPKRVYLTCNPGGVGHGWVKRLFVQRNFKKGENPDDYIFIQSLLDDNTVLNAMQPEYRQDLEALPHDLREAWLYGSWDMFSGQVFKEFVNEPTHLDRRNTHVIEPFFIPRHWTIYRSMDWGYSKPFSVGWYAFDEKGCCYRIRGWYGCSANEENVGLFMSPQEVAKEIVRIEAEDDTLKDFNILGVADPAIFKSDTGESIASHFAKEGVYFTKGDNHRIAGKLQLHNRLRFDDNGKPMFYVFNTDSNKDFVRTIPDLIYDENKPEDVNTKQEDHIFDECKYALMENPIAFMPNIEEPKPLRDDPLNMNEVMYF